MDILTKLKQGLVFFDGGLGSLLQFRGLESGTLPDLWNNERPDEVLSVHLEYLKAGADVINTNTFGSNRLRLGDKLRSTVEAGVLLARKAVEINGRGYVALDIGPTGKLLKPLGSLDFEDAVSLFAETVRIGAEAGADLINIETMSDGYETKAALLAAKENCSLPVFVSTAYDINGRLLTGADARVMALMLEAMGADAVGLNCGVGPEEAKKVIPVLSEYLSVPVIACPNAGLPRVVDGNTVFDVGPEEFAEAMSTLVNMGARAIGGCCGTTPAHISALVERLQGVKPSPLFQKERTAVTSGSIVCELGKEPVLIGERINPTGRKAMTEALRSGDFGPVLTEALEQKDRGVHIIDVNAGLPDIDETAVMPELIFEIQSVCNLPLQIDTSNVEVMERAARIYNGKPLLNSVDGTQERMAAVFPIAKKYGASVVALTLDENGIPATAEERLAVAARICAEAEKYGIKKHDLIFDPLVMAVAADPHSVKATLGAVLLIREKLGCRTMLGISNVSFGMPDRSALNVSFMTSALEYGLDAAFINPLSDEAMLAYRSFMALHGYDNNFAGYIPVKSVPKQKPAVSKPESGLYDCILNGLSKNAATETEKLLETADSMEIINEVLIPALDKIGQAYETGKAFLPQLLMSADAAKKSFAVISAQMSKTGGRLKRGKLVLATVKGDVHDIGKNIVAVLLDNYGFDVIDLGRDVSPEAVCNSVLETGAPVCGLSALMTTTVPAMHETIELLHRRAPECAIIVGGAVMTKDYADMIGADGYSKDAMGAVRLVENIFSKL